MDLHLNFKNQLLLIISLFIFGCGVKSPPLKHPDVVIESYVRNYTHESESEVNKEPEPGQSPVKAPQN